MNSFTVIFSKACSNGNHFIKLQRKGVVTTHKGLFGDTNQESQETYYVFGAIPQAVGATHQIDISKWSIETKTIDVLDSTTNALKAVSLKYLAKFNG